MRHYEIIFLVHPDQSEQVPAMLERYRNTILNSNGVVHRLENCGRRQLAYRINKVHKAHYVLMNVEADQSLIDELENTFRFNDAILRYLFLRKDEAVVEPSCLMKESGKMKESSLEDFEKEQADIEKEKESSDVKKNLSDEVSSEREEEE